MVRNNVKYSSSMSRDHSFRDPDCPSRLEKGCTCLIENGSKITSWRGHWIFLGGRNFARKFGGDFGQNENWGGADIFEKNRGCQKFCPIIWGGQKFCAKNRGGFFKKIKGEFFSEIRGGVVTQSRENLVKLSCIFQNFWCWSWYFFTGGCGGAWISLKNWLRNLNKLEAVNVIFLA